MVRRISYSGDPLTDFSTIAFLDRFSYKNPKLRKGGDETQGAGAMQRPVRTWWLAWGKGCGVRVLQVRGWQCHSLQPQLLDLTVHRL